MKYYVGFNWDKKLRSENKYPYCFLSVAVNYSYNSYKKLTPWKINNAEDIMLDSGGFSLLNRFGNYPFGFDQFINWVYSMKDTNGCIGYVATPDYPCEREITRTCDLKTNIERINKTVENTVIVMDTAPDIKWMPVIQGYTLDEYKKCFDLYMNKGIYPDKFAIGSMCRRSNVKQIEQYVKKLIEYGLSEKIHLFGLCTNGLKSKYLDMVVDSCDSIGYTFNAKDQKDTKRKFDEMMDRVGNYIIANKSQISLWDLYDLKEG